MRASVTPKRNIVSSITASSAARKPSATVPTAFISGPLDADSAYFHEHYIPLLRTAFSKGHHFVIGSSPGIDTLAFEYLRESGVPPRCIRLYTNVTDETKLKPTFRKFEEAGGSVVMVKGGLVERDDAMTRGSHYDILRCRTEEEYQSLQDGKKSIIERDTRTPDNILRRESGLGLPIPPNVQTTDWKD